MKKTIAALVLGVSMFASPAVADTMENAYGNTIVITYPSGASARYHFNADQTFTLIAPDGAQVTGSYEIAGDQICLTPAGGERACTQYVAGKSVGDSWTQVATDGSQITVTLQAGR
ncbi:MAG: hypothetical protein A4S17_05660 [Proteobacteria bacterium HN_bin10]|nr:MAG: hypothetical protein A4S17_05660 [Proteobacteria bacterium HN_bin10]